MGSVQVEILVKKNKKNLTTTKKLWRTTIKLIRRYLYRDYDASVAMVEDEGNNILHVCSKRV